MWFLSITLVCGSSASVDFDCVFHGSSCPGHFVEALALTWPVTEKTFSLMSVNVNCRASAILIDASMHMETQKCLSPRMFVEMLDRTCALRNATYDEDLNFLDELPNVQKRSAAGARGSTGGLRGFNFIG